MWQRYRVSGRGRSSASLCRIGVRHAGQRHGIGLAVYTAVFFWRVPSDDFSFGSDTSYDMGASTGAPGHHLRVADGLVREQISRQGLAGASERATSCDGRGVGASVDACAAQMQFVRPVRRAGKRPARVAQAADSSGCQEWPHTRQ